MKTGALALAFCWLGVAADGRAAEADQKRRGQCGADVMSLVLSRAASGPILTPDFAWAQPAQNYYRCLAFMERNPDRCGALRDFHLDFHHHVPADDERECRLDYERLALIKAVISRDAKAMSVCEEMYRRRGLKRARELCTIVIRGEDVDADCAEALPLINEIPGGEGAWENRKVSQQGCVKWLAQIRADEEAALKLGEDFGKTAGYRYKKALEAGNPALCGPERPGEIPYCRMLMGRESKPCEDLLGAVRSEFCGRWARGEMARQGQESPQDAAMASIKGERPAPLMPRPTASAVEWVSIPGGSFLMGSENGGRDERPVHRVTVRDFAMARTPVTFAQYRKCVEAGACRAPHASDGACFIYDGSKWTKGSLPASFQGDDQPVVCVDWEQAKAFSEWAGGRLPSEAEWEYAARGGGRERRYPWGDEEATCARAVMNEGGGGCGLSATWPVCSKPRGNTEQGLCDMAGNVWQWTQDFYHASYERAPNEGGAWEGFPGTGRVDRGGAWDCGAEYLRASRRDSDDFDGAPALNVLGFRPVKPAASSGSARGVLAGHDGWVFSVAFSSDGGTLASAGWDDTIRLWGTRTGQGRSVFRPAGGHVNSVAFSPDGRSLASANWDNTVRILSLESGMESAILRGHGSFVIAVAFSPDGGILASGSEDRSIRLWDVKNRRLMSVLTGHQRDAASVSFSRDGRTLASGGFDETVRLWDVLKATQTAVLRGHVGPVFSVAFDPRGEILASAGADHKVRLWDLRTREQRAVLEGAEGEILSVDFSPDGRTLAAGGADGAVRLWDMRSGRQRAVIKEAGGHVNAVAFSVGNVLAAAGDDRMIRLYRLRAGEDGAAR